jgi:hypothetical protein
MKKLEKMPPPPVAYLFIVVFMKYFTFLFLLLAIFTPPSISQEPTPCEHQLSNCLRACLDAYNDDIGNCKNEHCWILNFMCEQPEYNICKSAALNIKGICESECHSRYSTCTTF